MKCIFVIVLSALFLALTVAEYTEHQIVDICTKELSLSEDEISRISPDAFTKPTGNLKCFAKCYLEKTESVKDGVIQPIWFTRVDKFSDKETASAFVAKCSAIKEEDKCVMAIKFLQCNNEFEEEVKRKRQEKQ